MEVIGPQGTFYLSVSTKLSVCVCVGGWVVLYYVLVLKYAVQPLVANRHCHSIDSISSSINMEKYPNIKNFRCYQGYRLIL